MNSKLLFCFSGQGSHYYQMGKELYEQNRTFALWMEKLDVYVEQLIGESVISVLYDKNARIGDVFDRLIITHPAIFMFEYSLYQVMLEKQIYPDGVLGTSLGEYVSAVVSGVLDYKDVLNIIIKQVEIIENTCAKGGMMALLYKLENFNTLKAQFPDIELASINSANHFVISGPLDSLHQIGTILKNQDVITQILHVTRAFHSRFVDPAAGQFLDFIRSFEFKKPELPYISCVLGTVVHDADDLKHGYFWDACRKPILIKKTIETIEKMNPYIYLDLGPAGTSANLIKQNLQEASGSVVLPVISPFGGDMANLLKAEDFIKKSKNI